MTASPDALAVRAWRVPAAAPRPGVAGVPVSPGETVPAEAIAVCGGRRAVLRDARGRLWLAELDPAAMRPLIAGPVTVDEAVDAAVRACAGVPGHGSVSQRDHLVALSLVAVIVEQAASPGGEA